MARHRSGVVSESVSDLVTVHSATQEPELRRRVEMLLELAERPSARHADVAAKLRISPRTIRRWWSIYRVKGLSGLLKDNPAGAYSGEREESAAEALLRALAPHGAPDEWLNTLLPALAAYAELDEVEIVVTLPSSRKVTFIASGTESKQHPLSELPLRVPAGPYGEAYYILKKQPDGDTSLEAAVDRLRAIIPLLSAVALQVLLKSELTEPAPIARRAVLEHVTAAYGLTPRELDVLHEHVLGRTPSEIATDLGIAVSTVNKHVKSIHRKTGRKTHRELFALLLEPFSS